MGRLSGRLGLWWHLSCWGVDGTYGSYGTKMGLMGQMRLMGLMVYVFNDLAVKSGW